MQPDKTGLALPGSWFGFGWLKTRRWMSGYKLVI